MMRRWAAAAGLPRRWSGARPVGSGPRRCVKVGAGRQVVSQGVGRQGHTAEQHRAHRAGRPTLQVQSDTPPGLAGSQSGQVDPPGLVPAGPPSRPGVTMASTVAAAPPPAPPRRVPRTAPPWPASARSTRASGRHRRDSRKRTANRSGSSVPDPGMPRAVSAAKVSRTNRS